MSKKSIVSLILLVGFILAEVSMLLYAEAEITLNEHGTETLEFNTDNRGSYMKQKVRLYEGSTVCFKENLTYDYVYAKPAFLDGTVFAVVFPGNNMGVINYAENLNTSLSPDAFRGNCLKVLGSNSMIPNALDIWTYVGNDSGKVFSVNHSLNDVNLRNRFAAINGYPMFVLLLILVCLIGLSINLVFDYNRPTESVQVV